MGVMLSAPVELIRVQRQGNASFRCAVAEMQGWRTGHEDAHAMYCKGSNGGIFWVLDGHGGEAAAEQCAPKLCERSAQLMDNGLPADQDIQKAFVETDAQFRQFTATSRVKEDSGSTVVGALVLKQEDGTYAVKIANAGDSRALVLDVPTVNGSSAEEDNSAAVLLASIDHKPDSDVERPRIEAAGGFVSNDEPARLDGNLAVSRGFGDFEYKSDPNLREAHQKVSCIPEIYEAKGLKTGSICVIACDGLWDVMKNEEVSEIIRSQLAKDPSFDLGRLAADLIEKSLEKNSRDNVTVMIVQFVDGTDYSELSKKFNNSDEMLNWNRLQSSLDPEVRTQYNKFLKKCTFQEVPNPCSVCGHWHKQMWQCPGTDQVYDMKCCQKKGWRMHIRSKGGETVSDDKTC